MTLKTLCEFSLAEILPLIPQKNSNFIIDGIKILVKTSSLRLQVFKRSLICFGCGIIGSIFKLQNQNKLEKPHLNLYAIRVKNKAQIEFVLMTKDHIVPRSKGGKDCLDNLQTMCIECNFKKGNEI